MHQFGYHFPTAAEYAASLDDVSLAIAHQRAWDLSDMEQLTALRAEKAKRAAREAA
jgi:hypothetical protein